MIDGPLEPGLTDEAACEPVARLPGGTEVLVLIDAAAARRRLAAAGGVRRAR